MDYLGESGIGAWAYGTPEQAARSGEDDGRHAGHGGPDVPWDGEWDGHEGAMAQAGKSNPAAESAMSVLSHGYPWHGAECGDIDLTGFRKPQSYYRDILWNGGDRVYATVRLPEPEGKKTIAVGWAVYPTLPSWTWPGQEGKDLQVEVYSGAEKVRLYLNDKLIGEKPTGRSEEFKAMFAVPYAPGTEGSGHSWRSCRGGERSDNGRQACGPAINGGPHDPASRRSGPVVCHRRGHGC